jgi:hypothetical protein
MIQIIKNSFDRSNYYLIYFIYNYFSFNGIEDEGAISIASNFQYLKNLTKFNLNL